MKKIILTAAAVFAFGFANAQDVKFGAKVALNVSNISGDDTGDLKSLIGGQFGGFAEIGISDKFAIQPELMYSMQGAKYDGGKTNLSYLNVPVMAKYFVAEGFSLEAGPQIGFLLSAKDKEDGEDSVDMKDELESIDFGVNFGAGYDFTENLSAGLRYNLGLTNIVKNVPGEDFKITNNVFSVSLGYKF